MSPSAYSTDVFKGSPAVKSYFCGGLLQEQPPRGVLRKRCSKNMQQIYRRTPMLKCDFNKVAKQGGIHYKHYIIQLSNLACSAFFLLLSSGVLQQGC